MKRSQPRAGERRGLFYGWVIVGLSFIFLALAYAIWYSFAVFFVALLEEFRWGRAVTAGAFSVFVMVHGLAGPVVGWLADLFGARRVIALGALVLALGLAASSRIHTPWQFYLSFGVLVALGVTAVGWVPNITLLQHWFNKKLGTVIGLGSSGIGVGILAGAPVAQHLIFGFGWRGAYLIAAALILLAVVPLALLFIRNRPRDMGLAPDGEEAVPNGVVAPPNQEANLRVVDKAWASRVWTLGQAVRTPRFWLLFAGFFAATFATQMVFVHQVALLVDAGYAKMVAASVVGAIGIISSAGKVGWGFASDQWGRELTFTIGIGCKILGILLLLGTGQVNGLWYLGLYALFFGLGYAVTAPLTPTISADFFQGRSFGAIYGALGISTGLGSATGAWFGGYIFDLAQSYFAALRLGMVVSALSCVFIWLAAPRRVRLAPGRIRRQA